MNKLATAAVIVFVMTAGVGVSAQNFVAAAGFGDNELQEIRLWDSTPPQPTVPSEPPEKQETGPDGLTRRFNVSVPRLFVHPPQYSSITDSTSTDPKRDPATVVIVVPGGGFARLADEHEGSDVCRWLSSRGIMAFQLAYRTPTAKHERPFQAPVQDLQRAVELIRSRATEFGVNPNAIGILGFSAGGQTAAIASYGEPLIASEHPHNQQPNFLMLVYPYQLLGSDGMTLREELQLDSARIPVWIAQSSDDKASAPEGSIQMYLGLKARNIPAELHLYELGGHGFGMRPRPNANGSQDWSGRAEVWMTMHGWMPPQQSGPQKTQSSRAGSP